MNKVGILTLHRAVNNGAVLLAYCEQKILQQLLPNSKVEIVDYSSTITRKYTLRNLIRRDFPFFDRGYWIKWHNLSRFVKQNCELSSESCKTDDLGRVQRFIQRQGYDTVIVGSDIVWQVREKSSFTQLPPNIYFLPEIKEIKKISFAASADRSQFSLLDNANLRQSLFRLLNDFQFITVRDEATGGFLKKLGFPETGFYFMPDPTILWDFSELVERPMIWNNVNKPLAGLAGGSRVIRARIAELLIQKGYQVVDLLGNPAKEQLTVPSTYTLAQRLGVYSQFDLVITDRFHESILTMKLGHAPVIWMETVDRYTEPISKGRDLFQRLGISDMIWRYEGGEVLLNLDDYLNKWQRLSIDVKARFAVLREEAQTQLNRIQELIEG